MIAVVETTTHYKSTKEIFALVDAFESCTLSRAEWTHAAHLTVGLWYLLLHPFDEAVNFICNGIKRFNASHGIVTTPTGGYHETLTLFWIHTVNGYLKKHKDRELSFVGLANGLIEKCGDSKLPFEYYSRDYLFSPTARTEFVAPDLKPLGTPSS